MENMVKILDHEFTGDNVLVKCTEVDPTGARKGDFSVEVPVFDEDNETLDPAAITEAIVRKIKARHKYARGRSHPKLDLPQFVELDAEPQPARR